MEVGDLVRDRSLPGSRGIIIEARSMRHEKSKNMYITYLVHWFDTGMKSSHGPTSLIPVE
jgi:hypothetical protein